MTGQEVEPILQACMDRMILMLNRGQVLEALETFYADKAQVFENGYMFAESREEALDRQRRFVEPCSKIEGDFTLLYRSVGRGILVLHNKSRFEHPDFGAGEIDGLHAYYWQQNHIAREEYFSGAKTIEALAFWSRLAQAETDQAEAS